MDGGMYKLVLVLILLIGGTLRVIDAASISSKIDVGIKMVADNSFVMYLNGKCVPRPTGDQDECIQYDPDYCCATNADAQRCIWDDGAIDPDTFNRSIESGDVLAIKLFNFYCNGREPVPTSLIDLRDYCLNARSNGNPTGFMHEILQYTNPSDNISLAITWSCTPGGLRQSPILDSDSDRNWVLHSPLPSVTWTQPLFAGFNVFGAWKDIPYFNDPLNITCANEQGDSVWNAQLGFSPTAYWQTTPYPQSTYAYCRGVFTIVIPAVPGLLTGSSPQDPFSFQGTALTIVQNVSLSNNSAIQMSDVQSLNFSSCVKLGGTLTLSLGNISTGVSGNATVTPIYYGCSNNSKFDDVQIVSGAGEEDGCYEHSVEYTGTSMNVVLIRSDSCGGDGVNKALVAGVVAGVGGFLIIVIIVIVVVLVIVAWRVKVLNRRTSEFALTAK